MSEDAPDTRHFPHLVYPSDVGTLAAHLETKSGRTDDVGFHQLQVAPSMGGVLLQIAPSGP